MQKKSKKVFGVKKSVATKKAKKVEMVEMYYMTEKELTSKELLNSIEESDSVVVQVWEALGVASIEFGESGSVDFVKCNDVFEYQEDLDFLEEHHIKSAFEVTFAEENKSVVAKWFLSIVNEHGGFFCTDSDDFTPIYKKEELEQWR